MTPSRRGWNTSIYKITKIVRALWLAERRVCMRVCKHGGGFKVFCFSRANHASRDLKNFLSWKFDTFTLFTHFLVGWNLENLQKHAVSIFFRLSWHFKWEKPVFLESIFIAKQELIAYKLRVQYFVTGKNFSFNHCPKQGVLRFFWGTFFIKAIENFFPVFA